MTLNLSVYVTTNFRKTLYLNTIVTICYDIPSTVNHNTFLTDYKYLYIVETFSLPTDAHNVKKHRVIKTF